MGYGTHSSLYNIGLQLLQVCALVKDLEILEDGDESEIGERGVCAII
jgi:hypothetical protein